jgi:hypothetical protein
MNETPITEPQPVRFSLRRLMVVVALISVALFIATTFVRWINRPPEGMPIPTPTSLPPEIGEIVGAYGENELKNLQVWGLAGFIFIDNYVWRADTSKRAVQHLQTVARMRPISKAQVPPWFWKVPPSRSTMPNWWNPTATPAAEFYMTPEFPTQSYLNGDLNCCAMYNPADGSLYVMTQFDF